jgi:periplasmic protein TonB
VTLTDTFELLDIAPGEIGEGERDPFTPIDVAVGDKEVVEDERPEPTLISAPFFVEFDEPDQLDPNRAGLIWELTPPRNRAIRLRSPVASLAFHLLPVLGMVIWPLMMIAPVPPIPVQLVYEEPPPPPQPPPEPQPQQSEAQTAAATPPKPAPKPKPTPPQAAPHPPKPSVAPAPAPVPRHDPIPHDAAVTTRAFGSRDDYFAYLVELTRRHVDLLPRDLANATHGETDLSIQVQSNGTIQQIGIIHSSGNSGLDERVVAMVKAVGRFPPLPEWFQGNVMDMDFRMNFPLRPN